MRIVILTSESFCANYMTQRILQARPGQVVGIINSDFLINNKSTVSAMLYLLRRCGIRFVGRKVVEKLQSIVITLFSRLTGRPLQVSSLRKIKERYKIPIVDTKDINSTETIAVIKRWQPDIIISIYINQLIKRQLISLPLLGSLNIHPSLLPRNGGLIPYFWAIANGDKESGVTLHWLDEEFDTGDILLQEQINIETDDTVASLSFKSAQVGAKLIARGLDAIEKGDPPRIQQDLKNASYYSWPRPQDLERFRHNGGKFGSIFKYTW